MEIHLKKWLFIPIHQEVSSQSGLQALRMTITALVYDSKEKAFTAFHFSSQHNILALITKFHTEASYCSGSIISAKHAS